jgi:hypothetical protein
MSRPAPLQLHADARNRRLAVVTYGQDGRRFGFPPDVVRVHRNLSLAVIAVAMVAMAVVLL